VQQGSTIKSGQESAPELLKSIAEQLKSPLANIARQAELGQFTGDSGLVNAAVIQTQANAALTLVESYLLGLRLMHEQATLNLEPVSVSSTMVEIAHELTTFAKHYGVTLELHIAGKYEPVMAHKLGLRSALLALGYTLLEGYPIADRHLTLAVHRTPKGIVAGLYGNYQPFSGQQWRKAMELKGRASQPYATVCSGSGAGFFVAEAILGAMETRLRVGKHQKQYGLATTLQPSQQLQFV